MLAAFRCAENQPHRLILAFPPLILLEPGKIEIHLTFVGCGKCADLKVYGNEATQAPVVEKQIQEVIFVVNPHGILPADKTEIGSEF